MVDPITWYNANAEAVVARYESVTSEAVHGWLRDLLPRSPASVLDIGSGSGRDAAWLAANGHDVVAVEPSASMRTAAASLHGNPAINWIDDRLPGLGAVSRSGLSFDLILLSAVWMHVPERDRPRAFRKMINLLRPGGLMAITLRLGPADVERRFHSVSSEEIEALARDHGAFVEKREKTMDLLGLEDVHWIRMAIRLPDDGTGALPLLRHVILNDDKSSTYKLGLLRTLCRIADGAAGFVSSNDDDHVAVPLGLIALTWIRLYKPLLSAELPQRPTSVGLKGLGFVRKAFPKLADDSHPELRVGARFSSEFSPVLHQALRDAASTIERMPATHITYQGGGKVFPVMSPRRVPQPSSVHLTPEYLFSFGEMLVPRHLWQTLQRFGAWIEPAIVAEWVRLIRSYASRLGTPVDESKLAVAMTWKEPNRDVDLARERALELSTDGQLYCVWSGRRLDQENLQVDHCLPWVVWPCGDLWNLMPTHWTVNQNEKGARLPGDRLLRSAQDRVLNWWGPAYVEAEPAISDRFWLEAHSSLPSVHTGKGTLDDIFNAVCLQRIRLKHDQQVPEWTGKKYL